MKTVDFEKLYTYDFSLSDISVIYQTPAWNTLSAMSGMGRKLNGFLLIDDGECLYEWDGGSAVLTRGSLIYLPCGSKHTVTVTARPFSFFRISFYVTDSKDSEGIIFGETPMPFTYDAPEKLYDLSRQLAENTVSRHRVFRSSSLLYEMLHTLTKQSGGDSKSRISPAVRYLDGHYTESTDVDSLAKLCYISKPHLFRLFKKELGMSPVEYRNHLRIERAKELLSDGECSVSEIAAMLGFDGSYYFSRIFKEYTGISPSRYIGG